MVTQFDTSKNKFQFVIDGSAYVLPRLTFGDRHIGTKIAEAAGDGAATMKIFEDLIGTRADDRTRAAIDTLSITDAVQLFREWAGLTPGESSSSPSSSESTEPSSPTTSDTSAGA